MCNILLHTVTVIDGERDILALANGTYLEKMCMLSLYERDKLLLYTP